MLASSKSAQNSHQAQIDMLQGLFATGQYTQAATLGQSLLAKQVVHADVFHYLGLAQFHLGDTDAGLAHVENSLLLSANDSVFHANYGLLLQMQNRSAESEQAYKRALDINPDNINARFNFANMLLQVGKANRARKVLLPAISGHSDDLELSELYAQILFAAERWDQAKIEYENLCNIKPDDPNYKLTFCLAVKYAAGIDTAETCYLDCVAHFNKHTEAYEAIILFYESQNNLSKARYWLDKAKSVSELNQNDLLLLEARLYVNKKSYAAAQKCMDIINLDLLSKKNIQHYYYEAAKVYDKQQDYKTAFDLITKANTLKAKKNSRIAVLDHNQAREYYQKSQAVYVEKHKVVESEKQNLVSLPSLPIFIVGFPRSGSTMVEQILSSHQHIASGGELNFIPVVQDELANNTGQPDILAYLSSLTSAADLFSAINTLREQYFTLADASDFIDTQQKWFTDKRLFNSLELGFLSLVFPESPVIHVVRHPLDTCLSCYFTDFTSQHAFIYQFSDLAGKYNEVQNTVAENLAILPLNYYCVKYEDIVQEPDTTIKSMIDFVGEEWDENCLQFHLNKRVALTASYAQVNQKLYTSSVHRYKNYLPYLDELAKGLAPSLEALGYQV